VFGVLAGWRLACTAGLFSFARSGYNKGTASSIDPGICVLEESGLRAGISVLRSQNPRPVSPKSRDKMRHPRASGFKPFLGTGRLNRFRA
jgi:hypothetical protein